MFSFQKILLLSLVVISITSSAQQTRISVATDVGMQRSFKKEQQYWALGHTVQAQFHLKPKDAVYVWLSYYNRGKFRNHLTATAKSAATLPQQINYDNDARMRFKQFSAGWKKYFVGQFDTDEKWNLYGYAGFGLVFGRVDNSHSTDIDTALYNVPVRAGKANFKRLTVDLGLGAEFPLGAEVYLYSEGRVWLPTTDYPSKYIFVNKDAPLLGMFNLGLRVLF